MLTRAMSSYLTINTHLIKNKENSRYNIANYVSAVYNTGRNVPVSTPSIWAGPPGVSFDTTAAPDARMDSKEINR